VYHMVRVVEAWFASGSICWRCRRMMAQQGAKTRIRRYKPPQKLTKEQTKKRMGRGLKELDSSTSSGSGERCYHIISPEERHGILQLEPPREREQIH